MLLASEGEYYMTIIEYYLDTTILLLFHVLYARMNLLFFLPIASTVTTSSSSTTGELAHYVESDTHRILCMSSDNEYNNDDYYL